MKLKEGNAAPVHLHPLQPPPVVFGNPYGYPTPTPQFFYFDPTVIHHTLPLNSDLAHRRRSLSASGQEILRNIPNTNDHNGTSGPTNKANKKTSSSNRNSLINDNTNHQLSVADDKNKPVETIAKPPLWRKQSDDCLQYTPFKSNGIHAELSEGLTDKSRQNANDDSVSLASKDTNVSSVYSKKPIPVSQKPTRTPSQHTLQSLQIYRGDECNGFHEPFNIEQRASIWGASSECVGKERFTTLDKTKSTEIPRVKIGSQSIANRWRPNETSIQSIQTMPRKLSVQMLGGDTVSSAKYAPSITGSIVSQDMMSDRQSHLYTTVEPIQNTVNGAAEKQQWTYRIDNPPVSCARDYARQSLEALPMNGSFTVCYTNDNMEEINMDRSNTILRKPNKISQSSTQSSTNICGKSPLQNVLPIANHPQCPHQNTLEDTVVNTNQSCQPSIKSPEDKPKTEDYESRQEPVGRQDLPVGSVSSDSDGEGSSNDLSAKWNIVMKIAILQILLGLALSALGVCRLVLSAKWGIGVELVYGVYVILTGSLGVYGLRRNQLCFVMACFVMSALSCLLAVPPFILGLLVTAPESFPNAISTHFTSKKEPFAVDIISAAVSLLSLIVSAVMSGLACNIAAFVAEKSSYIRLHSFTSVSIEPTGKNCNAGK